MKVLVISTTSMGEIEGHPALQKAYELGKGI